MQYKLDIWLRKAEILEEVSKYVVDKLYWPPKLSNRVYESEVAEKFRIPREMVREFFIFLYVNGKCIIHSSRKKEETYVTPIRPKPVSITA
ncbi:MAG: hypothetical protein QXI11_08995 [Thermoproteota archaeon]